ncbi:MAG: ABC transporter permease [Oscillospiraceae bacterium]|jgi:ribose transport system permease protein|nr:ABC transporter permease [Oscillospiraceae bacterium]
MSQPTKPGAEKGPRLRDNLVKYFSFSAIVILVVGFTLARPNFLGVANLKTLLSDSAPLLIMATGMTLVLLLGSIDLSMGSVCSVANVLTVMIINELGPQLGPPALGAVVALLAAAAFGAVAGLLLGFVHVKLKVPSFIASLGFMSLWQSVAYLITAAPVSVAKVMWGGINWFKVTFGVVGLSLVLALAWVAVAYLFQSRTSFGKALYAIGGNERAARIAGTRVDQAKIVAFVLSGVCAAIGGYFLAAKLRSSAPTVGDPFTLLIVASVALGGTSLSGGRGGVLGTVVGAFTVSVIQNGMNFIKVDAYWQSIVFGFFVLAAVAISVDRSTRGLVVK